MHRNQVEKAPVRIGTTMREFSTLTSPLERATSQLQHAGVVVEAEHHDLNATTAKQLKQLRSPYKAAMAQRAQRHGPRRSQLHQRAAHARLQMQHQPRL